MIIRMILLGYLMLIEVIDRIFETSPQMPFQVGHSSQGF